MIELKNITKDFEVNKNNTVRAVNNINLSIKEGELIVLKGASGSGKSTILSLIASLSKPTIGEVIVNDKRVSKLPDNFASMYRREEIGFIFQKYNLIPTLSVKENILLPLIPKNLCEEEASKLLHSVMKKFKIEHKSDAMVKNLSGGEQQRVAIARSQINNPKIIIADEPTANLDKELSEHFITILKELKSSDKTIIVATHDPLFFELDFVDRVIELANGEIIKMILSPEVLTIIILNSIFLLFGTVSFLLSLKIFFNWDINSTNKKQYTLESQSFLTATIIKYILFVKILLFIFFIFTLDKISNVLTGAMCAAGVVDATSYGIYLLLFKLINIYFFGFWLVIHNFDMKTVNLKYTKLKFGFYLFIYFLLLFEIILEITMFASINVDKLVSCCGTLYSNSEGSYLSSIFFDNSNYILAGFYISYLFLVLFYFLKNDYLYIIFNLLFLILAIISLILFFGTYIYELPTHHCPFCMLQKEYHYIGYALYFFLFLGTFFGFIIGIKDLILKIESETKKYYKYSIISLTIYLIIVSAYPIVYYFKNGVFL